MSLKLHMVKFYKSCLNVIFVKIMDFQFLEFFDTTVKSIFIKFIYFHQPLIHYSLVLEHDCSSDLPRIEFDMQVDKMNVNFNNQEFEVRSEAGESDKVFKEESEIKPASPHGDHGELSKDNDSEPSTGYNFYSIIFYSVQVFMKNVFMKYPCLRLVEISTGLHTY